MKAWLLVDCKQLNSSEDVYHFVHLWNINMNIPLYIFILCILTSVVSYCINTVLFHVVLKNIPASHNRQKCEFSKYYVILRGIYLPQFFLVLKRWSAWSPFCKKRKSKAKKESMRKSRKYIWSSNLSSHPPLSQTYTNSLICVSIRSIIKF